LCPECEVVRTARARHCGVCNKCVDRYDHHCPWINNCVGLKNHNHFMKFIYFLLITLFTVFVSTIRGLVRVNTTEDMASMEIIYSFLPKSLYADKLLYQFFSWIVILFTGFFIPVILLLVFI
jgi:hypothetical protein